MIYLGIVSNWLSEHLLGLNKIISLFTYIFSFFPPAWIALIIIAIGVLILLAIKRIFF